MEKSHSWMSSWWPSKIFCINFAPSCRMAILRSRIWVRLSGFAMFPYTNRTVLDKRCTIAKRLSEESIVWSSTIRFARSSNFCNLKNVRRTITQSRSIENTGSKTCSDLFTLRLNSRIYFFYFLFIYFVIFSRSKKIHLKLKFDRSYSQS